MGCKYWGHRVRPYIIRDYIVENDQRVEEWVLWRRWIVEGLDDHGGMGQETIVYEACRWCGLKSKAFLLEREIWPEEEEEDDDDEGNGG